MAPEHTRWTGPIAGCLAAVATLTVLRYAALGLYVSLYGIVLAAGIALVVGTTLGTLIHPCWRRNAASVAFLLALLGAFYVAAVSQMAPAAGAITAGPALPR